MSTTVLSFMILGCLLILALMALAKPLRMMGKFLFWAAAGGCAFWVGQKLGADVGINPTTLLVSGVLGLPGIAGTLFLSFFL